MKKNLKTLFALLLMVLAVVPALAQRHFSMDIWQAKAPYKNAHADTARIHVFLPDSKKATGRAVVICPGGGYEHLAMQHEGYDWAPFFNNMGIAVPYAGRQS